MKRWLLVLAVCLPAVGATASLAETAKAVRELALDREECYRVRDLSLVEEDIRIFFGEGHLIFTKPVLGRRISAVFLADTDGGEGEVMLLPPDRAERRALAGYIESPNLDEHVRAALLLFTGDEYERLKSQIDANPGNKKDPEALDALDFQWGDTLRRLGEGYDIRLTLDLVGGRATRSGLFAALFESPRLGAFELALDPRSSEQIMAGQITERANRTYFDVWTNFPSRSARRRPPESYFDISVSSYRIDAAIATDLSMSVTTRVKVKPNADGMVVVPFTLSPAMRVTKATVDGRPTETLQWDPSSSTVARGTNLLLVAPAEALAQGREYELEVQHSGKVILDAGDRVYYVGARADWYPSHGMQYADFDLTFRYPSNLDLVAPGDIVEERVEGAERITRRKTPVPIRIAGFNLGDFEHVHRTLGPYEVDVCANRTLEPALKPRPVMSSTASPAPGGRGGRRPDPMPETPPTPSPLDRLQEMAGEISGAIEFMASKFGPPALPRITVSPIPGTFGQGFPGLIYLSTLSYLKTLPAAVPVAQTTDMFYEDVLQAHEVAHQWWGNRVGGWGYHDGWLQEALANYTALMYLEKRKGAPAAELLLDSYKAVLLDKNEAGKTVDSAGPIVLGERLNSSQEPRAWRAITYGKGSWILQMLRARMGTDRFMAMLAELVKRFDHKDLGTEQFREVAAQYLPPKSDDPNLESFFDQWVYGTGIPELKLTYSVKGKAPAVQVIGTLTQTGGGEDFSISVPIEIQVAGAPPITRWVRSADGAVTFTVDLKQAPSRVTLDPHHSILRQ